MFLIRPVHDEFLLELPFGCFTLSELRAAHFDPHTLLPALAYMYRYAAINKGLGGSLKHISIECLDDDEVMAMVLVDNLRGYVLDRQRATNAVE